MYKIMINYTQICTNGDWIFNWVQQARMKLIRKKFRNFNVAASVMDITADYVVVLR